MSASSDLVILLVEDNPADVVLFNEALEMAKLSATLHVVGNGEDAMSFLRRKGAFADAPTPDAMILDLNLPIKSGRDVLGELSADLNLHKLPVAILTTSSSEECICNEYAGGQRRYFVKTGDFHKLVRIVTEIMEFAAVAVNAND